MGLRLCISRHSEEDRLSCSLETADKGVKKEMGPSMCTGHESGDGGTGGHVH